MPAFLPDATRGFVRGVDAGDLHRIGVLAVVMNVFHLMQKPGTSTVKALGGFHKMSAWTGPVVTDSGGFQAYSLIRRKGGAGSITAAGVRFHPDGSGRTVILTPEKCVQIQLAGGSDVVLCLDDCTHADSPDAEQLAAVRRTVEWAKRGRREYDLYLESRSAGAGDRPAIFAVIQGGGSLDLRRRCAEALLEIGFDGYGFGGWPLDSGGSLLTDLLAAVRELVPARYPMHALGVGQPESVVACARMGYGLFDSALPTRDARTGRLYAFRAQPDVSRILPAEQWRRTVYIDDTKHIKSGGPICGFCDCYTCAMYSVGYLRHLRKCDDPLYIRLASIHNLRFMTRLTDVMSGP